GDDGLNQRPPDPPPGPGLLEVEPPEQPGPRGRECDGRGFRKALGIPHRHPIHLGEEGGPGGIGDLLALAGLAVVGRKVAGQLGGVVEGAEGVAERPGPEFREQGRILRHRGADAERVRGAHRPGSVDVTVVPQPSYTPPSASARRLNRSRRVRRAPRSGTISRVAKQSQSSPAPSRDTSVWYPSASRVRAARSAAGWSGK